MTLKKNTSRQYNYRNNPPLILSLVIVFLIIIGSSAFVPIRAMSTDSSKIDGCKPLLAEEGKEASTNNNCDESEEQQSGNNEILQLPESSNDPSIPTIKLGGESMRLCLLMDCHVMYIYNIIRRC